MSLATSWDNAPYLVLGIRRTPEESSTIFMPITAAIAEEGLRYFAALYELERRGARAETRCRQQRRQQCSKPIAEALRQWLIEQR
jgi:hypothetical protein